MRTAEHPSGPIRLLAPAGPLSRRGDARARRRRRSAPTPTTILGELGFAAGEIARLRNAGAL